MPIRSPLCNSCSTSAVSHVRTNLAPAARCRCAGDSRGRVFASQTTTNSHEQRHNNPGTVARHFVNTGPTTPSTRQPLPAKTRWQTNSDQSLPHGSPTMDTAR